MMRVGRLTFIVSKAKDALGLLQLMEAVPPPQLFLFLKPVAASYPLAS